MTDDLSTENPQTEETSTTTEAQRPDYLPEKFWDEEAGEARVDALAQSYSELEKRFTGEDTGNHVPESIDDYQIDAPSDLLDSAPEVNARLHEAGFSQDQAQLVYNLADEFLVPLVTELAANFESLRQADRLAQHFGGPDKWQETSRQIDAWAQKNLDQDIYSGLNRTFEGVLAMERMMSGQEPTIGGGDGISGGQSEADLRQLMADPRYWRDKDPALVSQVRAGFNRLYPGES